MHWSIRHQGSPAAVEHVSDSQVVNGLRDGDWEATDEIAACGTTDVRRWMPLERHPRFASLVAELDELEHSQPIIDPDEQRIDMNPLIDVCLVLLVFFMLATTMSVMERVHNMPTSTPQGRALPTLTESRAREQMIFVRVSTQAGQVVIEADDERVAMHDLEQTLRRLMRSTQRAEMLIDAKDVSWGTVVQVIDAATGAQIRKVHFKTP
jgi:biopolymer transport protein ExbD